jgi:hypothetical protein
MLVAIVFVVRKRQAIPEKAAIGMLAVAVVGLAGTTWTYLSIDAAHRACTEHVTRSRSE